MQTRDMHKLCHKPKFRFFKKLFMACKLRCVPSPHNGLQQTSDEPLGRLVQFVSPRHTGACQLSGLASFAPPTYKWVGGRVKSLPEWLSAISTILSLPPFQAGERGSETSPWNGHQLFHPNSWAEAISVILSFSQPHSEAWGSRTHP